MTGMIPQAPNPPRRPLTEDEQRIFAAYRRAADRLFDRFEPYCDHPFSARILQAYRPDEANLIPQADFIALLTAFRLFYATKERTNFRRVSNILSQVGDDEVRDLVKVLRQNWIEIPKRPVIFQAFGEHFDPESLVDTWMNGEVFHQDEDLLHRVDKIHDVGPLAYMVLQMTVRDLCYSALGLDNVIALVTGGPIRPVPGYERRNKTGEQGEETTAPEG